MLFGLLIDQSGRLQHSAVRLHSAVSGCQPNASAQPNTSAFSYFLPNASAAICILILELGGSCKVSQTEIEWTLLFLQIPHFGKEWWLFHSEKSKPGRNGKVSGFVR